MQTPSHRVLAFPAPPEPTTIQPAHPSEEALLGLSEAISRVRAQIARVAPYFRAAIVCGEPHTGAEGVARALHTRSPASGTPLLVLDAAAAAEFLKDCEGKGSPAGLRDAAPCTLFLPEIDLLCPDAQRTLLRRMRLRSQPLRVVASTHADLRACVSTGRFSLDLADALSAIRIPMPALRERKEDLAALAVSATQRLAQFAGRPAPVLHMTFLSAATEHAWTGNLRELESLLLALPDHGEDHALTDTHFTETLASMTLQVCAPKETQPRLMRLEDVVQEHIRSVLMASHGNKLRAAEILGISRSTLYRMLESYTPARLPLAS